MFRSKAGDFGEQELRASELAKALAHPAKVVLLQSLARSTCRCGELARNMPLAQSTVSKHLADLRKAGLVLGEDDGPRTYYRINWDRLRMLSEAMEDVLETIRRSPEGV